MHRIDTRGSVDGRFSSGNPAIGQSATQLSADWFNDVQDNVMAVLEEAGIVPTKGREMDLVDAIRELVAGAVGTGGGAVPTSRTVTGGGLATGGGALSADRIITVSGATSGQLSDADADDVVVTPAAMHEACGFAPGTETFRIPGTPIVIKRGILSGAFSEGQQYVGFGVPFDGGCFHVNLTGINPAASSNRDTWWDLVSFDANGFTAMCQWDGSDVSTNASAGFRWMAWGYDD